MKPGADRPNANPNGRRSRVVSGLAIGLGLFHLYSSRFGELVAYQHRAVHLAGMLALAFFLSKREEGKRHHLSRGLAWVSLVVGGYFVAFHQSIALRPGVPTAWDLMAAAGILLLVLEASRRLLGPVLSILSAAFLLYGYFGAYIPGRFGHRGYSLTEILEYTSLTTEGIFGVALGVSSTYIVLFVLFGAFLERTGLMDFFNETALAVAGRTRGGVAKVSVISSALLGTINGSAIANVVTVGSFTIPLMKRSGFSPAYAAAVEATASMGGQLMPPIMGVAAFLMADMLAIPYGRIASAAVIPAFLYFFAAGAMIHFRAAREGQRGLSRDELPRLGPLLFRRGYLLLPVAALVYLLFSGYTPTYAAVYSILFTVAVSVIGSLADLRKRGGSSRAEVFRRRGVGIADLAGALERGVANTVPVAVACAVVGIIVGVVTQTGLGLKLSGAILALSGGSVLAAAVLTMLASIVLGFGLPTIPTYIICVTMAAPVLLELGVLPLAAHLFVMYFGTLADLTPPVMLAVYAATGIAGANPWEAGLQSVKLATAGFVVPYIFIFSPVLLLHDFTVPSLVLALATAVVGVIALAAGMEGYLFRRAGPFVRAGLIAGALLLMLPGWPSDLAGLAVASVAVARQAWAAFIAATAGEE
ncbi:MAG TPA: TRAP transporter permease [Vicinamibacteria bacterium]|jgi:TRAP transporter 4TM/12TM fusion protein